MKILILSTISGSPWGGTEEVWWQFAKLALEQRHEVMLAADFMIAESSQVEELRNMGLQVSKRKLYKPVRVYQLKQKFFHDHADAIAFGADKLLVNSGSALDLFYQRNLLLFVNKLTCDKYFFCHFNSDRLRVDDPEELLTLLSSMKRVIFVADKNRELLERQVASKLESCEVILNGSRVLLEEPLPMPPLKEVKFANVARFDTYWKGQDLLLNVLACDQWRNQNLTLEFFGGGDQELYIRRLIDFYGLGQMASISGYERSLLKIWESRHALVLPSRGEGTPLVCLEAMMCGRPVITTDVGGNTEIIEDGVTGFIAEAATVKSFQMTMRRAYEQRARWEEMGYAAHENAKALSKNDPAKSLLNSIVET